MKNLLFMLIMLPFAAIAQFRIVDTAQQIVIGQVEKITPASSISLTQYIKGDTTYTLSYRNAGVVDMSASATFKAAPGDIEAIYNAFASALVGNKSYSVSMVLGKTPIVVSNYVKHNLVVLDIKMKESSFYLTKEQLLKLFGK